MPLKLPEKCLRDYSNCSPLSQIQSDENDSFICVGANEESFRGSPQDNFTLCWKNEQINECSCWDKRDLTDTASTILQALSIVENLDHNLKSS